MNGDSVAAAIFYVSLAVTVGAAMLAARATIERQRIDRRAVAVACIGFAGICVSIGFYAVGPHRVLPF